MFRPICLSLSGLPCVVETLTQKNTIASPAARRRERLPAQPGSLIDWQIWTGCCITYAVMCLSALMFELVSFFWPLGLSYWSMMLMISHRSCGRLKDGLLTLCCRVLHNAVYLSCTVGELLTLSVFNAALTGSDTGAVGHSEIGNRLSWIWL